MVHPFREHNRRLWTPTHLRSLYAGLGILVVAIALQIVAGRYTSQWAAHAGWAHDIILDNVPFVNLDPFIVSGAIVSWVVGCWLLIVRPKYLVFGIKAIALFTISRAFFMCLTHIGAYPGSFNPSATNMGWDFYSHITFPGDFFFSGHTGFPFLMALIFWDDAILRRVFLTLTVLFGAAVLLAHVHYSIDVFSAPFIVYGMYVITQKMWPRDWAIAQGRS